jgi:hypothetical protein
MSIRKSAFIFCLIVTLGCLGAGFGSSGQWWGVGIALVVALGWAFYSKASGVNPLALLGMVGLAAVGVLVGAPSIWMIPGAAAALAAWDLVDLDSRMLGSKELESTRSFELLHFRWLRGVLCVGLGIAALGLAINVGIPFIVLMGLIIVDLYGLQRLARIWVGRA